MYIIVIGAGALGGLVGTLLTRVGEQVTLYRRTAEYVEKVKANGGMTITFPDGHAETIPVNITNNLTSASLPDLVIIAVKSYDTEKAIKENVSLVGDNTWVFSLQNGAGNIEAITRVLGRKERVVGATITQSVDLIQPWHLSYSGGGAINLAPVDGKVEEMVIRLRHLLERAGFQVKVSDNIWDVIWNKLILSSNNAITAICQVDNREVLDFPWCWDLMRLTVREAAEVATARGINVTSSSEPEAPLFHFFEVVRKSNTESRSSTLQDFQNGRKLEIDYFNGIIVEEGEKLGIPTPVNKTIWYLLKTLEAKRDKSWATPVVFHSK